MFSLIKPTALNAKYFHAYKSLARSWAGSSNKTESYMDSDFCRVSFIARNERIPTTKEEA